MNIQNYNYSANFKAKFLHSEALKEVAQFAVETGRFEKLNKARKNIDSAFLTRKLNFELYTTPDGYPYVIFTRYTPKKNITIPKTIQDYEMSEPFIFNSKKKMNPLKFGFDTIIKLGNSAPKNNMYKEVVAGTIKK